jgi:hypothetical protein
MHCCRPRSILAPVARVPARLAAVAVLAVCATALTASPLPPLADMQSAPVRRPPLEAMPDEQSRALDQHIINEIKDHSEIISNLTYLSDVIGARLTGSDAAKRANDWTADRMRSYGLENVHLEAWTIPVGWERGTCSARVIEPDNGRAIILASAGWAPGTHGKVQGDVVIMEARTSQDLAKYKGKLKGAIVLQNPPQNVRPVTEKVANPLAAMAGPPNALNNAFRRNPERMFERMMSFRRELGDFLRSEGAVAIFQDAGKPQGLLNMTGSWRGMDRASAGEPIPSFFVAHEHYAMLYRLAKRPAPARTRIELEATNKFIPGPVKVYNTVGEIRGSERPDEFVIVGAHLDSWDLGSGTTDNGTGSSIVLEAARALSKIAVKPKRTIRFCLFTGEEQGLHGSRAYVKDHKDELPRTSMAVVHDTGTGKVTGMMLSGFTSAKPIMEKAMESLKPLGVEDINLRSMGGSDHASFDRVGVPGFCCQQDMSEYRFTHHSQSDTLDKAHEPELIQGAEVMAVTAMRVADLPIMLPRDRQERPSPRARASAGQAPAPSNAR